MVALVGAWGLFHVAQQGIHFGQGQLAACAHRAMTRHGGEQLVFGREQGIAVAHLCQFGEQVTHQSLNIAACQQNRHGAYGDGSAQQAQLQAPVCQFLLKLLNTGHFQSRGGEAVGNQQLLCGQFATVALLLEFFIRHALVSGVHVDQNQAIGALCQDVNAQQLCQSIAQWVF